MNKAPETKTSCPAEMVKRSYHRFYTMVLLYLFSTLFYYFGEILDLLGWSALSWDFFYGVHDVHRLLFLAPIIYAGYFFGVKAAIIITIVAVGTIIPRALFISPYPDPLLRTGLFIIIAGITGYYAGKDSEQRHRLEALVRSQRDRMLAILEGLEEGVIITGPDYRIRYMNPSSIRNFGEGIGTLCYQHLKMTDVPCRQLCDLHSVIGGAVKKWQYCFPNGAIFEVTASPYIDPDGTICQLAIFRKVIPPEKEASQ